MKQLTEAAAFWIADCGGDAAQALEDVRETVRYTSRIYRDMDGYAQLEAELCAYLRGELEPWVDPRGTEGE